MQVWIEVSFNYFVQESIIEKSFGCIDALINTNYTNSLDSAYDECRDAMPPISCDTI